ncbi:MAG: hypothetical protein AAF438_03080 [Pseudomonadota bacterium]
MDRRNFLAAATATGVAGCFEKESGSQLGASATDAGADAKASNDSTDAINEALRKHRSVFVPDGNYRIDGTVEVRAAQKLTLAHNAVLQRYAKHSENTAPVVRVLGRRSHFFGGQIVTENPHPEGIVTLGHESLDKSVNYNANDWYFGHTTLRGTNAKDNVGIFVPSSQDARHPDPSASNFFGLIEAATVIGADVGVRLTEVANAHRFVGVLFWNIGSVAYEMFGAYGNQVIGGFLHRSTDGVVGIKLNSSRSKNFHSSIQNSFIGFGIEPGGKKSKGFIIEKDCRNNTLFVQDNTYRAGIDHSQGKNFLMTSSETTVIPKAKIGSLTIGEEGEERKLEVTRRGLNVGGKVIGRQGIGVGNSQSATKPGSIVKKIEVFDAQGRSLGYVPVYDTID